MAIDPLTVTLVSAVLAGIGAIILKLHINRCNLCCINSDCRKSRNNSMACLEEIAVEPTAHISTPNTPNTNRKVSDV